MYITCFVSKEWISSCPFMLLPVEIPAYKHNCIVGSCGSFITGWKYLSVWLFNAYGGTPHFQQVSSAQLLSH